MSLANIGKYLDRVTFIEQKKEVEKTMEYVNNLRIKLSGIGQKIATLSGGNQQKVIVSRWLQKEPLILIMDEPTRGLDIRSKAEIRNIMLDKAKNGTSILLISSDLEEIMSLSDRYIVINRGTICGELPAEATKDDLMAMASGAA
jgi:ABC-type sugar transport system ATPase subunit